MVSLFEFGIGDIIMAHDIFIQFNRTVCLKEIPVIFQGLVIVLQAVPGFSLPVIAEGFE